MIKRTFCLLCVVALLTACQPHPTERAAQQVPYGTPRDDAVEILSQEAWYHQPCRRGVSIKDLFFYGSHRYDKADIVIVDSSPRDEGYEVVRISTFESYAWHTAYRDCIDRGMFED